MTDLLARDAKVALRPKADTNYQSAAYQYADCSAYISTEGLGDVEVQHVVQAEWLAQGLDDAGLAGKISEEYSDIFSIDDVEEMIAEARKVWESATTVSNLLACAVEDYAAGNLAGVVENLRAAAEVESEHGAHPASTELAKKLIAKRITMIIIYQPHGAVYGIGETLDDAIDNANECLDSPVTPADVTPQSACAGRVAPGLVWAWATNEFVRALATDPDAPRNYDAENDIVRLPGTNVDREEGRGAARATKTVIEEGPGVRRVIGRRVV